MNAVRAALAPVIAAVVTLGLLTAWTQTGRAGRASHVRVGEARVVATDGPWASTYFTLVNDGDVSDTLTQVRVPESVATAVGVRADYQGIGVKIRVDELTVPARDTVRMNPSSLDFLMRPNRDLRTGERVPFTLVFRRAGTVRVTAPVVSGGIP